VLETLEYLVHETNVWVEITTLLIPGLNDSDAELERMAAWVVEHLGPSVPWHFSAFHPDFKMRDIPQTPRSTLRRARDIAIKHGVRYAYVGNVHDERCETTYCHACGGILVGRDWYRITDWRLTDAGRCTECGEACAGVFGGPAGTWGPRRLPVRIGDYG
jgi:pyruvate formate lyase activating enzyme